MAVDRYQAIKAHLNVKTIANHLTLLGSLLGLAHDLGWMPRVPKIKKPKVRLVSHDFSYLRTIDEIWRFLVGAEAEEEQTHVLYATALYTGSMTSQSLDQTTPAMASRTASARPPGDSQSRRVWCRVRRPAPCKRQGNAVVEQRFPGTVGCAVNAVSVLHIAKV